VGVWMDVKTILWIAYNNQQDQFRPVLNIAVRVLVIMIIVVIVATCF
jgi:hypothetical protein